MLTQVSALQSGRYAMHRPLNQSATAKTADLPFTHGIRGKKMNELEYARMMLDNHISGLEISKAAGYWNEDDERTLELMRLIRNILRRIKPKNDTD